MQNSCIFCKISSGQIPAKKHFQNKDVFVIDDISPQAKIHALIIPNKHIPTMNDLTPQDSEIPAAMFQAVHEVKALLAPDAGFNILCNNGVDAGQSVAHLHWHFLSGKNLNITK